MAVFSRIILGNLNVLFILRSSFSSSSVCSNKWRALQNLEPNPNAFGPLTNLRDFSYVDGRPVPLSQTQRNKIKLQRQYCETIARLSSEIDVAVEYHEKKVQADAQARQKILNSKFKPKGAAVKK